METIFKFENQPANYGILIYKENGILYGISGALSLVKDYRIFSSKLNSRKEIAFVLSEIYRLGDVNVVNNFVNVMMKEFHQCLFP
jgi:hypothetical protein